VYVEQPTMMMMMIPLPWPSMMMKKALYSVPTLVDAKRGGHNGDAGPGRPSSLCPV
jgi:hypothetical protein